MTTEEHVNTSILDDIDIDEDLKAFLAYVNGKESSNEFVQELQSELEKVKSNENWRRDYMMQHINDQLKIEEGKAIGKEIGKEIEKVELIRKKVQKSKSLEIIADELECEPEEIRKLYDIIQKCGVEVSAEGILEELARLEEK